MFSAPEQALLCVTVAVPERMKNNLRLCTFLISFVYEWLALGMIRAWFNWNLTIYTYQYPCYSPIIKR